MEIKRLTFGVHVDINLSNCSTSSLKQIAKLCAKERLVILKKQNISLSRFSEINDFWGTHRDVSIWATHKKCPKVLRITNKYVEEGKRGFLLEDSLNWHSDRALSPKPEQCAVLWCIDPGTSGGETEFADGVHAYNNLNPQIREEIQSAYCYFTSDVSKTCLKRGAYKYKNHYEKVFSKFLTQKTRQLLGGKSCSPEEKTVKKPLVVKHPVSGHYGLHFLPYHISKIHLVTPHRSKEIFRTLVENYIGRLGKTYTHKWDRGDIILSDQIHSLHRRNSFSGMRELYRTAFWYHAPGLSGGTEKQSSAG